MKYQIEGKIVFDVDVKHPDFSCMKKSKGLEFSDVYTMDLDYFYGPDDMKDYIKSDLALVAGGGYNTDHIHNVKYEIKTIATW